MTNFGKTSITPGPYNIIDSSTHTFLINLSPHRSGPGNRTPKLALQKQLYRTATAKQVYALGFGLHQPLMEALLAEALLLLCLLCQLLLWCH
jgi:hypothetical protein